MENIKNIYLPWPEWKIVRYIGGGGYGKVYEIERNMEGILEKAAVKIIARPRDESEIEEYYDNGYSQDTAGISFDNELKNYVKEYQFMKELQGQTHIVSCDDYAIVRNENGIGGKIFLRMELLTSLQQILRERSLSEKEIIKLGKDISHALMLCESKKIIHRDIKPCNILLSPFGDYKLGDFGVSKVMNHTTFATAMGTQEYQAPEVVHMEKYGQTADIYSLGITLYWLLNNRKMPFVSADEMLTPIVKEQAAERRYRGEKLPEPRDGSTVLKQIVLKACAYRPEDRYASAKELYEALDALKNEKNTSGKATESYTKTVPPEWEERDSWGNSVGTIEVAGKKEKVQVSHTDKISDANLKAQDNPAKEKKGSNKKFLLAISAAIIVLAIAIFAISGKSNHKSASSAKEADMKEEKTDNSLDSSLDNEDLNYVLTGSMYTKNSRMGSKVNEEDVKNVKYETKKWAVEKDSSGKSYNLDLSKVPIAFSGIIFQDYIVSDINLKNIERRYGSSKVENFKTTFESVLGKSIAEVRYTDQAQKEYRFLALYEFNGKKLKLTFLDHEKLNNNELVEVGTEEYKCKRVGNEITISKDGSKVTLLPAELTTTSGEDVFRGCVSNDKEAFEDIAKIFYSENKSYIYFTNGDHAIDPVITLENGKMTMKWKQRWVQYNGSIKKVDDEKEYTVDCMVISKYPFNLEYLNLGIHNGGLIIKKDGATYKYLSSEDEYESQKLSGTVEETDISELSDDEKSALVGTQTNIMSEVEKGLSDAGIKAEVDQTTGQVNLDSSILFALNDATLSDEGKSYLNGFLDVYTSVLMSDTYKNSIAKIKVEGYTDSSGTAEYNQILSEQRAASVVDYCVSKLPDIAAIIEKKGYGSSSLVYDENGNENADASRRVAFKFALNVNQ